MSQRHKKSEPKRDKLSSLVRADYLEEIRILHEETEKPIARYLDEALKDLLIKHKRINTKSERIWDK